MCVCVISFFSSTIKMFVFILIDYRDLILGAYKKIMAPKMDNPHLSFDLGTQGKPAVAILSCILARQLCFEDPSCSAILEIIPRVCGPVPGKRKSSSLFVFFFFKVLSLHEFLRFNSCINLSFINCDINSKC